MKKILASFLLALLAVSGCKDDEVSGSATVNGSQFVASQITVTDTGAGLLIELTKGQEIIRIWTSEKKSGTFPVLNTTTGSSVEFPGNPNQGFAVAQYINAAGVIYFSETGTVTVTVGSSTKGSFSFDAETSTRSEVEIRSGSFSAPLSSPMLSGCTIESVKYIMLPVRNIRYGYDHHGLLTMVHRSDDETFHTRYFYSWFNDELKSVTFCTYSTSNNFISSSQVKITYSGNRISTLEQMSSVTNFNYDLSGRLASLQFDGGDPLIIEYDAAGNVVRESNLIYSNFDNQNNPATLYLNALQNQQALLWYFAGGSFAVLPVSGGVNNPQQLGEFTYSFTYNNRSYPLTRSSGGPGAQVVEYTYRNCR